MRIGRTAKTPADVTSSIGIWESPKPGPRSAEIPSPRKLRRPLRSTPKSTAPGWRDQASRSKRQLPKARPGRIDPSTRTVGSRGRTRKRRSRKLPPAFFLQTPLGRRQGRGFLLPNSRTPELPKPRSGTPHKESRGGGLIKGGEAAGRRDSVGFGGRTNLRDMGKRFARSNRPPAGQILPTEPARTFIAATGEEKFGRFALYCGRETGVLRKNLPPHAKIGFCGPPEQSGRRSIFSDFQILIGLQNSAGSCGEPAYDE